MRYMHVRIIHSSSWYISHTDHRETIVKVIRDDGNTETEEDRIE